MLVADPMLSCLNAATIVALHGCSTMTQQLQRTTTPRGIVLPAACFLRLAEPCGTDSRTYVHLLLSWLCLAWPLNHLSDLYATVHAVVYRSWSVDCFLAARSINQ